MYRSPAAKRKIDWARVTICTEWTHSVEGKSNRGCNSWFPQISMSGLDPGGQQQEGEGKEEELWEGAEGLGEGKAVVELQPSYSPFERNEMQCYSHLFTELRVIGKGRVV